MVKIYQHEYLPLSVYGNVVSLLRDSVSGRGVHLDIGCGYGAIAEPVRDEFGLTYIGFDLAEDGLESLNNRGFATFRIDLAEPSSAEETIRAATVGKTISSITLIDILEHLANGADILAMLRRIAASDNAPLVLTIPNVSHKDISLKLLAGRWDITEAGLLAHTHLAFYTHSRLTRVMAAVGW